MVQTKQRQLILEAVRATNSHPTADELFQMIRRLDPHDHMICDDCGQVVDFALLGDLKQQIAQACGAQVAGYTLVAHGTCAHCMEHKA